MLGAVVYQIKTWVSARTDDRSRLAASVTAVTASGPELIGNGVEVINGQRRSARFRERAEQRPASYGRLLDPHSDTLAGHRCRQPGQLRKVSPHGIDMYVAWFSTVPLRLYLGV